MAPREAGPAADRECPNVSWRMCFTMEIVTQQCYRHGVPMGSAQEGPRVRLTWRRIRGHSRACGLAEGSSGEAEAELGRALGGGTAEAPLDDGPWTL